MIRIPPSHDILFMRFAWSLALLVLLAAGCRRAAAPSEADAPAAPAPDRENWDVRFRVSQDGAPRLVITAPYMAYYDHPDSAYTVVGADPAAPGGRVTVEVFEDGAAAATVTADRLRFPEGSDAYTLTGGVRVDTPEGRHLETDTLVWFEGRREIETDGFVRITSPTERIQGYDLVADEDLERYTLARISGQVEIEE